MSTKGSENTFDRAVIHTVSWSKFRMHDLFMRFFEPRVLVLVRSFINRAYERGFVDSRAYHDLHALADRAFKEPSI